MKWANDFLKAAKHVTSRAINAVANNVAKAAVTTALALSLAFPAAADAVTATFEYVSQKYTQMDSTYLGDHLTFRFDLEFPTLKREDFTGPLVINDTTMSKWTLTSGSASMNQNDSLVSSFGTDLNIVDGMPTTPWFFGFTSNNGTMQATVSTVPYWMIDTFGIVDSRNPFYGINLVENSIGTLRHIPSGTEVPLPPSVVLMGTGFLGLLFLRRRSSNQSTPT